MMNCFAVMAREEGIRSFWRGTVSSWMKVCLRIGSTGSTYTVLLFLLQRLTVPINQLKLLHF